MKLVCVGILCLVYLSDAQLLRAAEDNPLFKLLNRKPVSETSEQASFLSKLLPQEGSSLLKLIPEDVKPSSLLKLIPEDVKPSSLLKLIPSEVNPRSLLKSVTADGNPSSFLKQLSQDPSAKGILEAGQGLLKFLPTESNLRRLIRRESGGLSVLPNQLRSIIDMAADASPLPIFKEIMDKAVFSQFDKFRLAFGPGNSDDPDIHRNTSELISSKGYPVEDHEVETRDGYILSLQRIPRGRNDQDDGSKRPVIYVQHGLMGASSDWVLNFPEQSLGFVLADAGYDVWLGNTRGNKYSRRHVKYAPTDSQFWRFSWHEIGMYDLPAVIDYILDTTGEEKLYYVGHSMGTTAAFVLLTERPEYNQKIKGLLAMAPVANVTYMTSPIRALAPIAQDVQLLLKLLGHNEFAPGDTLSQMFTDMFCLEGVTRPLCETVNFLIGGVETKQLNRTRVAVYMHHFPAGTSTYTIIHYAQVMNAQRFQKFDHGDIINMEKYGQVTPPAYDMSRITVPVGLYWSLNDLLADPTDVALLKPNIRNLVRDYMVPFPQFTHLDFAIAKDAKSLLYDDMLTTLEQIQSMSLDP